MAQKIGSSSLSDWAAWGRLVEKRRLAAGLSRAQLAKRVGIDERTVAYVETNRHKPSPGTVRDLCAVPELRLSPPPVYFQDRASAHAFLVPISELQAAPELLTVLLSAGLSDELSRAAKTLAQRAPAVGAQAERLLGRLAMRNGELRACRRRRAPAARAEAGVQ